MVMGRMVEVTTLPAQITEPSPDGDVREHQEPSSQEDIIVDDDGIPATRLWYGGIGAGQMMEGVEVGVSSHDLQN
jgi:hypothetical protein